MSVLPFINGLPLEKDSPPTRDSSTIPPWNSPVTVRHADIGTVGLDSDNVRSSTSNTTEAAV